MSVENSHIILCEKCNSKFDVTSFKPGQKLRCSECKTVMVVPVRETTPLVSVSVTPPLEEIKQEPKKEEEQVSTQDTPSLQKEAEPPQESTENSPNTVESSTSSESLTIKDSSSEETENPPSSQDHLTEEKEVIPPSSAPEISSETDENEEKLPISSENTPEEKELDISSEVKEEVKEETTPSETPEINVSEESISSNTENTKEHTSSESSEEPSEEKKKDDSSTKRIYLEKRETEDLKPSSSFVEDDVMTSKLELEKGQPLLFHPPSSAEEESTTSRIRVDDFSSQTSGRLRPELFSQEVVHTDRLKAKIDLEEAIKAQEKNQFLAEENIEPPQTTDTSEKAIETEAEEERIKTEAFVKTEQEEKIIAREVEEANVNDQEAYAQKEEERIRAEEESPKETETNSEEAETFVKKTEKETHKETEKEEESTTSEESDTSSNASSEEEIPLLPLPIKLGAKAIQILKEKGKLEQIPKHLLEEKNNSSSKSNSEEDSSESESESESEPKSETSKSEPSLFPESCFPSSIVLSQEVFALLSRALEISEEKLSQSVYSALGLKNLETNPEKINKRIRQALRKLKNFQEDTSYEKCRQFILQLRKVLENPKKKEKYDRLLQKKAPLASSVKTTKTKEDISDTTTEEEIDTEESPVDTEETQEESSEEVLSEETEPEERTEEEPLAEDETEENAEDEKEKKTLAKTKGTKKETSSEKDKAEKPVKVGKEEKTLTERKKTERLQPKKEKKTTEEAKAETAPTPEKDTAKPRKRTERVKKGGERKKNTSKKPLLFIGIAGFLAVGAIVFFIFFNKNSSGANEEKAQLWSQYYETIAQLEKKGSFKEYENPLTFVKYHYEIAKWCRDHQKIDNNFAEKYELHLEQVVLALKTLPEQVKQDPWAYKEAWQHFGYNFDASDNLWKTEKDQQKQKESRGIVQEILGPQVASVESEQFEIHCQEGGWFSGAIYLDQFLPRLTKAYESIVAKYPKVKDRKKKLRILIFGDKKAYMDYARRHRPEAEDEPGVYFPDDSLLVILRNKPEQGKDTFSNEDLFHHGNFYEMVLSKDSGTPVVITNAEVSASEVLGENVAKHRTKHYFIAVQFSPKYNAAQKAIEAGQAFEELYRNFYAEMMRHFPDLKDVNRLMPYFIFKDRDEYVNYGKKKKDSSAEYAGGHYEPWSKRMMTFYSEGDENGWAQEVIFHEGTHQLMHFIANYNSSIMMWFSEGVADYISGFRVLPDGKYEVARVNNRRLQEYQMYLKVAPKKLMTTDDLLKFTYARRTVVFSDKSTTEAEKSFLFGRVYYQAWVTVYYFLKGPNEDHRKRFLNYFKAELEGKGGLEKIRECFEGLDMNVLDREIRKFAETLRTD